MKKYLNLVTLFLMASSTAALAQGGGDSKWIGSGTLYGLDGAQTGTYGLELSISSQGAGESRQEVKVSLPNGQVETIVSTSKHSGNGFEIVSGEMKGGGYCFGSDLCSVYLENATTGVAYATTLVKDGDNQMRQLRTELKAGRAQRFYSEIFHKIQ